MDPTVRPRSGQETRRTAPCEPEPPSQRLHDERDALPAADARRADPRPRRAAAELVHEMRDDPRAARRERVPERDRAAVHVRAIAQEPERLLDREILRREDLVHLEQVKVPELR